MRILIVPFALLCACSGEGFESGGVEAEAEAESEGEACTPGETRCSANLFQTCGDGGGWDDGEACPQACAPEIGCTECVPGAAQCGGNDVLSCDANGAWVGTGTTCDPAAGDTCSNGACVNACVAAASSDSYIGCEYWPTVTVNSHLGEYGGDFDFAVAVANPNAVPVTVTVTRGASTVSTTSVDPGEVSTIVLPWVDELLQRGSSATEQSRLVADGSYKLASTMPVSAYQFNPLQFAPAGVSCEPGALIPEPCSYSNDASLLLPKTGLGPRYVVIARPTFSVGGISIPGFFSVVATEDGTSVMIRFSAYTQAGGGVGTYAPGDTETFSLDAGDVLQFVSSLSFADEECQSTNSPSCNPLAAGGDACIGTDEYDFTGTVVEASSDVAVFAGHSCTFIPYYRWACDHNEEQMTPHDTWGTSIIGVSTEPQAAEEPNVWKLVSGSAGNTIAFEPALMGDVNLDEGEHVEFEYQGAFRVESTTGGRIALAQFMVGEDYAGLLCPPDVGDPAMALAVPYEQFRTGYSFLTPSTYTESYVNVIAPMDGAPTLDGDKLPELYPIAGTGFGYIRVQIDPGQHSIESLIDPQPFGIMVSGIASYTSYLYAGGLDLESLPID